MTKADILDYFRADPDESDYQVRKRVAMALGMTASAVHQWPDRLIGRYWGTQAMLEILTGGELVASLEDFYHQRPRARHMPRLLRGVTVDEPTAA